MARFYGWGPDLIESLDTQTFSTYQQAIAPLKSSEQFDRIKSTSYPHMKEGSQDKYIKSIKKPLDPFIKKKDLSEIDMQSLLGGV